MTPEERLNAAVESIAYCERCAASLTPTYTVLRYLSKLSGGYWSAECRACHYHYLLERIQTQGPAFIRDLQVISGSLFPRPKLDSATSRFLLSIPPMGLQARIGPDSSFFLPLQRLRQHALVLTDAAHSSPPSHYLTPAGWEMRKEVAHG